LDTEWGLTSESNWNETDFTFQQKNDVISDPAVNRFYTIIYQEFADKNNKDNFINSILTPNLIKTSETNGEKDLKKKFTEAVNEQLDLYNKEYKDELKIFKTIKDNTEYKNWITEPYYSEKTRATSFVTNNDAAETFKNQLTYIYSTVNTNTDKTTYLGKVKLN